MPEHKISDMSEEQLRAFIREEVRKMLQEQETAGILADTVAARMVRDAGIRTDSYRPRNLEVKGVDNPELPAWARNGQWS